MRAAALLFVAGMMILAAMGSAQAAGISVTKVEGTIYQFGITETYAEPIRWSFGDGTVSEEPAPVHEFGNGLYTVRAEDSDGKLWTVEIDTRIIQIDEGNATVSVGGNVMHGGILLASGIGMCWLAGTNQHVLGEMLGRWKGLLVLAYVIMIGVGGYLVLAALYGGA